MRGLWSDQGTYSPLAALAALADRLERWLPAVGAADWRFLPDPADDADDDLPPAHAFLHAVAGLISLADWIASNPDTGFFPFDGHQGEDRFAWARHRAVQVLRSMRIDLQEARNRLNAWDPSFEELFHFFPTAVQAAMADARLGLTVAVEADTGSGKTEAALWRFVSLFRRGEVDSLYFALPTRIAAKAIEARINCFVKRLFPDPAMRPNVVLAVPGYLQEGGAKGIRLARFEVLWPDDQEQQKAHLRWAAENAKRYLAAAISVGTIDQALLAGLQTRHAHLRGIALARSLLVVDEVHASDIYMTQVLCGLLARQQALGGHALLLSATLGADARTRLLDPAGRTPPPAFEAAVSAPYPAISDASALCPVEESARTRSIRINLGNFMGDPDEIARRAASAAIAGAHVLVVRNTVAGAIAVQRALEALTLDGPIPHFRCADVIAPHHGRFAAEDRELLDRAVETSFGKTATRPVGLVLVGTQTLEQSLDIDADFMITDICPADVLLQRLGRLHRRDHARPEAYANPSALILTPSERGLEGFLMRRRGSARHGLGPGSVYENLLSIEATWRELERTPNLLLPSGSRSMVERATNRQALQPLAENLGAPWVKHLHDLIGIEAAGRTAAAHHLLDWRIPWESHPWARDLGEAAKTRLGLDDRITTLDRTVPSPFGQRLTRIRIPGWMLNAADPGETEQAAVECASDGILRFRCAGRPFRYSRLGLEVANET